jgi:uncharacterized protein
MLDSAIQAFWPGPRRHERPGRPGTAGERVLQERLGSTHRAERFYRDQVTDYLTPVMQQFIGRMSMAFVATSDGAGECDCTFRAGPEGFIRVLGEHAIAYPEYRGNGVMASLGNILQNPHIGMLMVDFTFDLIGLHVNGEASIVPAAQIEEFDLAGGDVEHPGRPPEQWVLIEVEEAYIHCSKHIPKMVPESRQRHWNSDNPRHKGGDYFGVAAAHCAQQAEAIT